MSGGRGLKSAEHAEKIDRVRPCPIGDPGIPDIPHQEPELFYRHAGAFDAVPRTLLRDGPRVERLCERTMDETEGFTATEGSITNGMVVWSQWEF